MSRMARTLTCRITLLTALLLGAAACATSPTGRKQLILVPDSDVNQAGVQAFSQLKGQTKVSTDPKQNQFVQCVAQAITSVSKSHENAPAQWEIVVFDTPDQVNAFALPGGKIGVFSGILPVTKSDAQLAAVIGHEVGHVLARHGAERMSQAAVTQEGLAAAGAATGGDPTIGAALGLGAQYGVLLPFSRTQESEADHIGLLLMAEAGFDPHQAIDLWKNMDAISGGKAPPAFLSDHPSNPDRISALQAEMNDAVAKFNQAHAQGRNPHCAHP